ncbi:hypothetical protein KUL42_32950 [Alteromonas sp. KUL42]|jgi:hypothetical protein|uniref:hypothetical protein n=1 Tax=Alteromonas sp. KUL42 TaxID=2480797 RepID=UPI00103615C2|nr:hypothetical protein [Alteromonas sp. KUL42]TAP33308.1 hypothetical protein EYR97_15510 [Alteromonas sp. KUL42]GEA08534.1 hypothetical protein KUL42_32950 [Alteromonas sp. KUL42]
MQHGFAFTIHSIKQLKGYPNEVRVKLFQNFINYFKAGHDPSALPGKYKPDWEAKFVTSPMVQGFIDLAKEKNIHHYHFGYKMYEDGRDEKYPGNTSSGIIHNRIEEDGTETRHVIIEVCLKHPSPFKTPWNLYDDAALVEVAG